MNVKKFIMVFSLYLTCMLSSVQANLTDLGDLIKLGQASKLLALNLTAAQVFADEKIREAEEAHALAQQRTLERDAAFTQNAQLNLKVTHLERDLEKLNQAHANCSFLAQQKEEELKEAAKREKIAHQSVFEVTLEKMKVDQESKKIQQELEKTALESMKLQADLGRLQTNLSELQKTRERLKNELTVQINDIQVQLETKEREWKRQDILSREKNAQLRKENQTTQEIIDKFEEERERARETLRKLQQEKEDSKKRGQREEKNLRAKIQKKESLLEQHHLKVSEFKAALKQATVQTKNLETQLKEVRKELEEKTTHLFQLEGYARLLTEEKFSTEELLKEKAQQLEELSKILPSLRFELSAVQTQASEALALATQVSPLRKEKLNLERQLESLNLEYQGLNQKLEKVTKRAALVSPLRQQNTLLQKEKEDLQFKLEEALENQEENRTQLKELIQKKKIFEDQIIKRDFAMGMKAEELHMTQDEIKKLQESCESLTAEKIHLLAKITEKEGAFQEASARYQTQLQAQLQVSEEEKKNLHSEIEALKKERELLIEQQIQKEKELQKISLTLEETKRGFEEERECLEKMKEEAAETEENKENLVTQIETLEEQAEVLRGTVKKTIGAQALLEKDKRFSYRRAKSSSPFKERSFMSDHRPGSLPSGSPRQRFSNLRESFSGFERQSLSPDFDRFPDRASRFSLGLDDNRENRTELRRKAFFISQHERGLASFEDLEGSQSKIIKNLTAELKASEIARINAEEKLKYMEKEVTRLSGLIRYEDQLSHRGPLSLPQILRRDAAVAEDSGPLGYVPLEETRYQSFTGAPILRPNRSMSESSGSSVPLPDRSEDSDSSVPFPDRSDEEENPEENSFVIGVDRSGESENREESL